MVSSHIQNCHAPPVLAFWAPIGDHPMKPAVPMKGPPPVMFVAFSFAPGTSSL